MSQQGDITASLTLDRTRFSTELRAAVADAQEAVKVLNALFAAVNQLSTARAATGQAQVQQRLINEQKAAQQKLEQQAETHAANMRKRTEELAALQQRQAAQQLTAEERLEQERIEGELRAAKLAQDSANAQLKANADLALANERLEAVREKNRRAEEQHLQRIDGMRAAFARKELQDAQNLANIKRDEAERARRQAESDYRDEVSFRRQSAVRQAKITPGNITGQIEELQRLEAELKDFISVTELSERGQRMFRSQLEQTQVAIVNLNNAIARNESKSVLDITRGATQRLYEYEIQLRRGRITQAEFIEGLSSLSTELLKVRNSTELTTLELQQMTNAVRRIESRKAAEELRNLGSGFDAAAGAADRLAQVAFVVGTGFGLSQMGRYLDEATKAAYSNQASLRVLQREVESVGGNFAELQSGIAQVAREFNVNADDIAEASVPLVRFGFTAETLIPTLRGVAASALAVGRGATDGINTFGQAVGSQNSNLLNSIGILQNFDFALRTYAKSLGKSKDDLTDFERSQAIMTLVLNETQNEIAAAVEMMAGYGGAVSRATASQALFQRAVGQAMMPIMRAFYEALAIVLNAFSALPAPIRSVIVVTTVLAAAVTALTVAYVTLGSILTSQAVMVPLLTFLLRNETIMRTGLATAIIRQAVAYEILTKRQAVKMLQDTAQLGLLGSLRVLYTALSTAIIGAARATAVFIASNPIVLVIAGLIAGVAALIKNFNVLRPAVDALAKTFSGVGTFLGTIVKALVASNPLFSLSVTAFRLLKTAMSDVIKIPFGEFLVGLGIEFARLISNFLVVANDSFQRLAATIAFVGRISAQGFSTQAWEDYQEELRKIGQNSRYVTDEVNRAADAAVASSMGIEVLGDEAGTAADQLGKLSEGAQATADQLRAELADFKLTLNIGEFQQQLNQAVTGIDQIIEKFKDAKAEAAKSGDTALASTIQGFLDTAQGIRANIIRDAGVGIVRDAEAEVADAQIEAMEDGDAKVRAQFALRKQRYEQETLNALQGLEVPDEVWNRLIAAYNAQMALLDQAEAEALADAAQRRLEAGRQVQDSLANLAAQVSQGRAELGNDTLESLRQAAVEEKRQLDIQQRDYVLSIEQKWREGLITEQQGMEATAAAVIYYNQLRAQIDEGLTQDSVAEIRRRQQLIIDAERETQSIRSQMLAATQTFRGDDAAALKTQLDQQLRAIRQNLQDRLGEEGVTAEQAKVLRIRAMNEELAARQQYTRDSISLAREEENARIESAAKIAGIYSDAEAERLRASGDDRGALDEAYENDLRQLEDNLRQQLNQVGLSQEERQRIIEEGRAEEYAIEERHQLAVQQLYEETEQRIRELRDERIDAQIENVEGDLPQLRAKFAQETDARRRAFQEELREFDGNQQQRSRLIRENQLKEQALTRTHQNELGELVKDATTEYAKAYQEYIDGVIALQRQQREGELANLNSLNSALLDVMNLRLEMRELDTEGDLLIRLRDLNSNYQRQRDLLRENLAAQEANTQALRDTSAASADIIASLGAEQQARKALIESLQTQIDKLKSIRDEQLAIIGQADAVQRYAELIAETTRDSRADTTRRQEIEFLNAEISALEKVAQAQIDSNAPIAERVQILEQAKEAQEELQKLGGGFRELDINPFAGQDAMSQYKEDARDAAEAVKTVDEQLADLSTKLADAMQNFAETYKELQNEPIAVDISVDMEKLQASLDAAKAAMAEKLGPELANQLAEQGNDAGSAFMRGMKSGVDEGAEALYNAVLAAVSKMDKLLPHSDAKEGPLADLSYSGRSLPRTMAKGMMQELPMLQAVAERVAAAARPSLSIPSSLTIPALAIGAQGGAQGDTYIQVGDSLLPSSAILEAEARRLGRTAMNEGLLVARRMGIRG